MPRAPNEPLLGPEQPEQPATAAAGRCCVAALTEKRTITLIYIPAVTAVTTLLMTLYGYEMHGVDPADRQYLVSCAVNYYPLIDEQLLAGNDPSKCRSSSSPEGLSVWPTEQDPSDCCVSPAHGFSLSNTSCLDGFVARVSDVPCNVQRHFDNRDKASRLYTCCANASSPQCEYRAEQEDNGMWLPRWVLWHLVLVLAVETKLAALPRALCWMPLLWGISLAIIVYSGSARVWGFSAVTGGPPEVVHIFTAMFAFFYGWWEAVTAWCPTRAVHCLYFSAVVFNFVGARITYYVLGASYGPMAEASPEWLVLGLNLVIVWSSMPRVEAAVQDGTYHPWGGPCCGCCCGCRTIGTLRTASRPPCERQSCTLVRLTPWLRSGCGFCPPTQHEIQENERHAAGKEMASDIQRPLSVVDVPLAGSAL